MGAKILYKDRAVLVEDDNLKILAIADLHLNDEDESVHEIIKSQKRCKKAQAKLFSDQRRHA